MPLLPSDQNVIDLLKFWTCLMRELTSQCAQHYFADFSEVCSDIVILGLALSLVFAQKDRKDFNASSMYT